MIPTTIRLTDKQRKWVEDKGLSLSKYIRIFIDEQISIDKKHNQKKNIIVDLFD